MSVELSFRAGTIEVRGLSAHERVVETLSWDDRAHLHRAPASSYAAVVRELVSQGCAFVDHARAYEELSLQFRASRSPRPYQSQAVSAWKKAKGRGVVVLPTGSGKSHVALMAMHDKQRSTLIVAPTLDLVRQWYDLVRSSFGQQVGLLGGGEHEILPLTIATYDSAYLHMEHLGNRFGLVVFDECHHLPGHSYALTARLCLAPYRLGLTATPERADGRDELLQELIGETVYSKQIGELSGEYLAEYSTERVVIDLSDEERRRYQKARDVYLAYVRSSGISMAQPGGFADFVQRASQSERGREALACYREQRSLAFAAAGKLNYLGHLLSVHQHDRMIVFTQDNRTAYEVSRRFLVPVITHQTKVKERSEILEGLHAGRYRAIATSKVLNEGVDVPSANVAVVVSGSGSVMEHVQRLGRILRRQDGKQAILYELVSRDTSETNTSERRREHQAYKGRGHSFRRRS